ncbi:hypothetical protein D3C71_1781500 [compost metagenome]
MWDVTDLGNTGESNRKFANLRLRHPMGQQSAEKGSRQHAVGEHVRCTRLAGKVDVDMYFVVIAGCACIERKHRAIDWTQLHQRYHVTFHYIAELRPSF